MKKEDLKAGYVLVFEDGGKRVLTPLLYQREETLALFWDVNDVVCQQISTYDPFIDSSISVVEVWGMSDMHSQSMTTNLDYRELLWKKEKPIKVTGDELAVLRNLPSVYKYIARDKTMGLWVYTDEPYLHQDRAYLGCTNMKMSNVTKLTFDIIKPLTCHKISDLL